MKETDIKYDKEKELYKELVKVCCESHGGPVGLHCNHDHCTGPVLVCPECHLPDPDHKMDCSKNR